jgi:hypothetical protein
MISLGSRRNAIQCMQFFSWLESNRFARGDAYLCSGARIAPDPSLTGSNTEHSKSTQFNAFAGGESLFQALKHRIHRCLRLGPGQACALNHMMDNILLDQRGNLSAGI